MLVSFRPDNPLKPENSTYTEADGLLQCHSDQHLYLKLPVTAVFQGIVVLCARAFGHDQFFSTATYKSYYMKLLHDSLYRVLFMDFCKQAGHFQWSSQEALFSGFYQERHYSATQTIVGDHYSPSSISSTFIHGVVRQGGTIAPTLY